MAQQTTASVAKVYDFVYNKILSGEYEMGAPISEAEIASNLGVSRSPVREALNQMVAEGLVNHYAGRGSFVTGFSISDLEEIFELRIMFELYALKNACIYMDNDTLDRLESGISKLNSKSKPEEFFSANNALHTAIVAFGGNSRLQAFYSTLQSQFAIVNRITARDPAHFEKSKATHLGIVSAIKSRKEDEARKLLYDHLNEVRHTTIREFSKPNLAKRLSQQSYNM